MIHRNGSAGPALLPHADPFYRPAQAAAIVGKNVETVRQHIRAGALKAVPLGKRSLGIRASELQRWMDAMAAGDPQAFALPARKPKAKLDSSPVKAEGAQ